MPSIPARAVGARDFSGLTALRRMLSPLNTSSGGRSPRLWSAGPPSGYRYCPSIPARAVGARDLHRKSTISARMIGVRDDHRPGLCYMSRMRYTSFLTLLLVACASAPAPKPIPTPVAECWAAEARLTELGCSEAWDFTTICDAAALDGRPFPVGCIVAATTCDEARKC
jgi:hypothetical protein